MTARLRAAWRSTQGLRGDSWNARQVALKFVTYSQSGDDASINDVAYFANSDFTAPATPPEVMYVPASGSTGSNYDVYRSRDATKAWESAGFSGNPFNFSNLSIPFSPTDAGFQPSASPAPPALPATRIVLIKRAWGYRGTIGGKGDVREPIKPDSDTHINALKTHLKKEENTTNSEIKNAAQYTPLAGTLQTVKSYFQGQVSPFATPISQTCQKNYVVLATDGVPTGKPTPLNSQYTVAERTNTKDANGVWTFGVAQQAVFTEITNLHTTSPA